jgi:hypothetical protein
MLISYQDRAEAMPVATHRVTVFRPYSFAVGEKIRIDGGARAGDREVLAVSEHKVRLRCPISGREFEWDRFCYLAENLESTEWPSAER